MSTLHTVNRSPFSHSALQSCLAICAPGDAVLLIEDGVYAALPQAPSADQLQETLASGVGVLALTKDTSARGLTDRLAAGVELTDYNGFVELACTHQRIQSWY